MYDISSNGIEATATGVSIKIYVAPRASANKVIGAHNGSIKVALTAPPVDGAANRALVWFLAKALGVPNSAVSLALGEASRNKVVHVMGISQQTVLQRLRLSE